MYSTFGAGTLILIIIYLVFAAIGFGLLYLCIRLAVLSALKAHTQWVQSGAPGMPPAGPPAPPRGPVPAAS